MDTTWRKIYRKTLENAVVRRFGAPALGVLTWMILQADDEGMVRLSVRETARELKVSYQTLRSILDALQADGAVSMECGAHGSVATLENWRKYQPTNAQVTHNQRTSNAHNTNEAKELNTNSTHNQRTSNAQVTHPTQEPENPPRTPSYRIRGKSVCVAHARTHDDTHTPPPEIKKLPETAADVQAEAQSEGISMSEDDAKLFLSYNRARGWRLGGDAVEDWTQLLGHWDKNRRKAHGMHNGNAGVAGKPGMGPSPFSGDYSTTIKRNDAKKWE